MAYTALYRKWRPNQFEEVRGQEHIVRTLRNQILSNRIGHAYLFCGTRGTGKTTLAKIFARAVNCEHPVNGSPCNQCATCQSILTGSSVNVVEIDAASNNGVDNIRDIRDEVRYSPTEGKYRVYIIDEVHMLSAGAFNALLKTLEEPPSYVIFILATTEAHRIPITVLSRCQRYDFRRITNDTLEKQLRKLVDAEGVEAQEKALRYLARMADGSMRDALSLLEQCISFYFGEELTYDKVLEVLGAVDTAVFRQILGHILKKDVAECIRTLDEVFAQGRDMNQFVTDFIWYLRGILLVQTAEHAEEVLDMSTDNLLALKKEAEQMELDTLLRYIRVLSELSSQMKYATSKRVLLEVALIKLMRPSMEQDVESLIQRVNDIERQLETGIVSVSANAGGISENRNALQSTQSGQPEREVETVEVTPAQYEDYVQLKKDWKNIVQGVFPLYRGYLSGTAIGFDRAQGCVSILFDNEFYCSMMKEESRMRRLREVLEERYHRQFSLTMKMAKEENPVKPVVAAGLSDFVKEEKEGTISIENINMDIGVE